MKIDAGTRGRRVVMMAWVLAAAIVLTGCAGETTAVDRAEKKVAVKEKAVTNAEADLAAASEAFCEDSKTYVVAIDRYGDVLTDTAPTVGDVKDAGEDLAAPAEETFNGAEAAVEAQHALAVAEQELADAQAALAEAQAGTSGAPEEPATDEPTSAPLAPAEAVDRVTQAEADFAAMQSAVTDQTPLADAAEQFNAAAVALELAWLQLLTQTGCLTDEQKLEASAAASAYTTALQQGLATAGYYAGAVDGVYGPQTVAAVEQLQSASGLPVTGTVDKATAEALQAALAAQAGTAAQESMAATAAVQQTLKLVGFWDAPVDGVWTPALTEAVQAFQVELGVEPTGTVDAATISAFEKAISDLQEAASESSPSPTPSE